MRKDTRIINYFNLIEKQNLFSNQKRLKNRLDYLFRDINFKDKKVLEIGSGIGLFSFYAACQSAKEVVCLEPETDGSQDGMIQTFDKIKKELDLSNIVNHSSTFQDFESKDENFDIIIMHNSINHLSEDNCIRMHKDDKSYNYYVDLFNKLFSISKLGCILVIADCTKYNFFNSLGIKNPFAPTIEWHKHQSPSLWSKALQESGFRNPVIRWTSFNALGNFGRIFFGNKVGSFFTKSHFCLTMEK